MCKKKKKDQTTIPQLHPLGYNKVASLSITICLIYPSHCCHISLSEDEKVIIFYRNEASAAVARSIEILFYFCTCSQPPPLSLSR